MRAHVAPLVLACYVFAQCAAFVCGRGCFNPTDSPVADASFVCALQFFATGMEGKKVSLKIFNPLQGVSVTRSVPFDQEKAVVEFRAPVHDIRPACLHLDKIEVNFRAPYPTRAIDNLVLDSFEGARSPTQEPLGECFTIEQHVDAPGGCAVEIQGVCDPGSVILPPRTVTSVYGTVYTDLWCAFEPADSPEDIAPPEQIAFEQRPGTELQSGC